MPVGIIIEYNTITMPSGVYGNWTHTFLMPTIKFIPTYILHSNNLLNVYIYTHIGSEVPSNCIIRNRKTDPDHIIKTFT